ncbi:MAG: glycosyltransferase family 2 protein [Alphaproteobacteria bacterium]
MSEVKLSLLIVAHNEEQQIADCIKSGAFADEIVVLLDRSTDQTGDIAEKLGAKLVPGAWPDEGERRSAGIEACSGDWVLELDGDERITPELATEITDTLPVTSADYCVIPFRNYVGGRYVQYGWGAYNGVGGKAALFRRGKKHWHSGTVHPKITLEGQRGEMIAGIDHYVDDDMAGMYARLNSYSSAAAADAVAAGTVPGGFSTFRRFFSRFLQSYFGKKGHREGYIGVAMALFSAMYPVLTYIKAQEILRNKKNQ